MFGYNVPPPTSSSSFTMFQQPSNPASTMFPPVADLPPTASPPLPEGGAYEQHQQFAAPIALSRASLFQTPIFGIE